MTSQCEQLPSEDIQLRRSNWIKPHELTILKKTPNVELHLAFSDENDRCGIAFTIYLDNVPVKSSGFILSQERKQSSAILIALKGSEQDLLSLLSFGDTVGIITPTRLVSLDENFINSFHVGEALSTLSKIGVATGNNPIIIVASGSKGKRKLSNTFRIALTASSNPLTSILKSKAKRGTCSDIITNFFLQKWKSEFMSTLSYRQTKIFYNEMCPVKS